MKWRNQLLALFCLALFVAGGVFYFRNWVVQKPYGIILFIGEGLDTRSLAAARVAAGGADQPLTIDSLPFSALLRNYSNDSATPDAAAAASALATGTKVNNGAIATSPSGGELQSILRVARDRGHMVGLVTNGSLTAPTAASFYAHGRATDDGATAAQQLVEQAKLDVVLGGGAADFGPVDAGGTRSDERDLITELRDAGYEVVRTLQDLEDVPRWRRAKLVGLFSQSELDYAQEVQHPDDQPTLSDMVRRAIELLQYSRAGYVLVVDAALARKAHDERRSSTATSELLELDRAVAVALEYAGNKAAVFVCGDPSATGPRVPPAAETGESTTVSVTNAAVGEEGGPSAQQNASPQPSALANADPSEPASTESSPQPTPENDAPLAEPTPTPIEPAPVEPQLANVPAEDSIVFGIGMGANALHGSLEDTEIFEIIRENL
jgi:alkaline phosphatase